jgi:hypothetical protein
MLGRAVARDPWNGPMATRTPTRLVVIGASGSGKSTFAARIGAALHLPAHDLDVLSRRPDGRTRDLGEATARVAAAAAGACWVIEGVFAELAEVALARATTLVWLDLAWDECRAGLMQRGPHYGMDPNDPEARLAWAKADRDRRPVHARLYATFGGRKVRLRTRREVEDFAVDRLPKCFPP